MKPRVQLSRPLGLSRTMKIPLNPPDQRVTGQRATGQRATFGFGFGFSKGEVTPLAKEPPPAFA